MKTNKTVTDSITGTAQNENLKLSGKTGETQIVDFMSNIATEALKGVNKGDYVTVKVTIEIEMNK